MSAFRRTPTMLPRDPKRSFRIRSRNMLKKSMELTDINARIAIYMERGNDKPDYDEFRYSSSPRSSPVPDGTPTISSAVLDTTVAPQSIPEFVPPALDTFSVDGLQELQLATIGEMDPYPFTVAMSLSAALDPVAQPGEKRTRPVSVPATKSAAHKQRRRAKTTSWFD
ncbi:hypothetical protein IF1G_10815 [Cordyceps javanica]|uniref:Uncharacterized protein n=1 Tax=Cordyceps javanica TaxID=43265 RepID=A0A545ULZ8_9HYPO|nr:hypothetical protein IF1G_10815 [Cordyceps javanica]TQW01870.1 hypothetical protein IF2G_10583 [Cordyceps javanica]